MVTRRQAAMGLAALLVGVMIGLQVPGLFAGSSSGLLARLAQSDTPLIDPSSPGPLQQGPDTQPGPAGQPGPAPQGTPLPPGVEATKPPDPMAPIQPPTAPQQSVPTQPQTAPGVPGAEPTKPGTAPVQPVPPGQAPVQPAPQPFPLGPGLAPPQSVPQPVPPGQVPAQPGLPPGQQAPRPPDGLPPKEPGGRPAVPNLPGAPMPPGAGPGVPLPPGPGLPPMMQVPPGAFGMPPGAPGGPMLPPLMAPGPGLGMGPLPGMSSPEWGGVPPADVAYGADPLQHLDVYQPRGATPAPMLLFVHGGGWSMGDKAELSWLGSKLAEQGVLVAVANYRLSPAVQHPAHAQDVAHALAWLYRNGANYGGDPQRLYVGGHSAGAHLAALVSLDSSYLAAEALSPSIVRGVVGISGAGYDLDARYAASPLAPLYYGAFGKDPARWAAAAPLKYVGKSAPPFLLIHGLDDTQAPAAGAQSFAQALKAEGAKVRLELLPGLEHGTALLASLPTVRGFVQ
jgi:acetyl esterase/lipase